MSCFLLFIRLISLFISIHIFALQWNIPISSTKSSYLLIRSSANSKFWEISYCCLYHFYRKICRTRVYTYTIQLLLSTAFFFCVEFPYHRTWLKICSLNAIVFKISSNKNYQVKKHIKRTIFKQFIGNTRILPINSVFFG